MQGMSVSTLMNINKNWRKKHRYYLEWQRSWLEELARSCLRRATRGHIHLLLEWSSTEGKGALTAGAVSLGRGGTEPKCRGEAGSLIPCDQREGKRAGLRFGRRKMWRCGSSWLLLFSQWCRRQHQLRVSRSSCGGGDGWDSGPCGSFFPLANTLSSGLSPGPVGRFIQALHCPTCYWFCISVSFAALIKLRILSKNKQTKKVKNK